MLYNTRERGKHCISDGNYSLLVNGHLLHLLFFLDGVNDAHTYTTLAHIPVCGLVGVLCAITRSREPPSSNLLYTLKYGSLEYYSTVQYIVDK